jgi:hypothetical protein
MDDFDNFQIQPDQYSSLWNRSCTEALTSNLEFNQEMVKLYQKSEYLNRPDHRPLAMISDRKRAFQTLLLWMARTDPEIQGKELNQLESAYTKYLEFAERANRNPDKHKGTVPSLDIPERVLREKVRTMDLSRFAQRSLPMQETIALLDYFDDKIAEMIEMGIPSERQLLFFD